MESRDAIQVRFQRPRFGRGDAHDVGHAVGVRSPSDVLQLVELRGVGRDDQLSAAPVRHVALGAVAVEALSTLHTGARLERVLRVVDPGVDDLGIARARVLADRVLCLEDHDISSGGREGARDSEAHHPGADNDCVNAVHEGSSAR